MKTMTPACVLACAAAFAPAISSALTNGSFEDGLTGWDTTGNVAVKSAPPYLPTDGAALVAFNSANTVGDAALFQELQTETGHTYRIDLDVGNLGFNPKPQKIEVLVGGVTPGLETYTLTRLNVEIPGTTRGRTNWLARSLTFTPRPGLNPILAIWDRSTISDGLDLVLDNIRLTDITPSFVVTTQVDENDANPGVGTGESLREVIARATSTEGLKVVRFDPSLDWRTLMLPLGELVIPASITIDASDLPHGVTVDGVGSTRGFYVLGPDFDVTLRGFAIRNCHAFGDGGGILLGSNSRLTLDGMTISGNTASGSGGGIANINSGVLGILNSHIDNNRCNGDGGGVFTDIFTRLTLDKSLISGNRACGAGGGLACVLAHVSVSDSTLMDNRSGGAGGGLASYAQGSPGKSGSLMVVNSTLTGNKAVESGAAIEYNGGVSLNHCTIVANSTFGLGALHTGAEFPNLAALSIENSIVAANLTEDGMELAGFPPSLSGNNILSGDPMVAVAGDYGGPTPTMPPLAGSPAIDAAVPLFSTPPADQRGVPRPVGAAPDIGAVEGSP